MIIGLFDHLLSMSLLFKLVFHLRDICLHLCFSVKSTLKDKVKGSFLIFGQTFCSGYALQVFQCDINNFFIPFPSPHYFFLLLRFVLNNLNQRVSSTYINLIESWVHIHFVLVLCLGIGWNVNQTKTLTS